MEGEVSPVTPEELADIRARDSEDFPPGSSCSVSEALEAICDRHLLLAEIDRLSSEREYLVEVRHTDGGTIDEILLHESGGGAMPLPHGTDGRRPLVVRHVYPKAGEVGDHFDIFRQKKNVLVVER